MALASPCPHCQRPITLDRHLTNLSLTLKCQHCEATLHYKPWVWPLQFAFLLGLVGILAGIGVDDIVDNQSGARALLHVVFLVGSLLCILLGMATLALQPFVVKDSR